MANTEHILSNPPNNLHFTEEKTEDKINNLYSELMCVLKTKMSLL